MHYGYFKYQVISFGLFNTVVSFQRYINKILAKKLDVFVILYLDDIMIYTIDASQGHMEAVWCIFRDFWKHSFIANLKKCCFYQEEVCFLVYIVSSQGIRMEEEKIDIVKDWPKSKSVRDI